MVGRLGGGDVGLGLGVHSLAGVGYLGDIPVDVVGGVGDGLDAAVGERDGVGAGDDTVGIAGLGSVEVGLGVVVGNTVGVGVGLRELLHHSNGSGVVSRGGVVGRGGVDGVDQRGVVHGVDQGGGVDEAMAKVGGVAVVDAVSNVGHVGHLGGGDGGDKGGDNEGLKSHVRGETRARWRRQLTFILVLLVQDWIRIGGVEPLYMVQDTHPNRSSPGPGRGCHALRHVAKLASQVGTVIARGRAAAEAGDLERHRPGWRQRTWLAPTNLPELGWRFRVFVAGSFKLCYL